MERRARRMYIALLLLAGVAGCSDDDVVVPPQEEVADNCEEPSGSCALEACAPEELEARHVDVCSVIEWPTNPPTSGQHYPIWAAYQTYDEPVPRGFWLHSVEHSGIVLAYNCDHLDGSCPDLVAELESFKADFGDDDLCDESVGNRIVITPDPLLDVAFAAVAWGHVLKGSCFDEALVSAFADEHYGNNYENFCSDGVDPTDPEEGFDEGCGMP
jgi:hypothetical protein